MDHFAGLDVSVKETSVCIVDDAGKIVREVKVASEPDALLAVLTNLNYRFKRCRTSQTCHEQTLRELRGTCQQIGIRACSAFQVTAESRQGCDSSACRRLCHRRE